VNILLDMKSQLAAVQGYPAPPKGKSRGKKWQGKRVAYPRFPQDTTLYTMTRSNSTFWILNSSNYLPTDVTDCFRIININVKLMLHVTGRAEVNSKMNSSSSESHLCCPKMANFKNVKIEVLTTETADCCLGWHQIVW
jgi:hypothetical protein